MGVMRCPKCGSILLMFVNKRYEYTAYCERCNKWYIITEDGLKETDEDLWEKMAG